MGFIQRVKDNLIDAQPMTPQNLCIKMLLPLFPMISKQIAGRLKNKGQRNMRWIRGGTIHFFRSIPIIITVSIPILFFLISLYTFLSILFHSQLFQKPNGANIFSEHFKITLKSQENVKTDTHLTAFDKLELIAFLRRFQIWAPYNRTHVLATHSQ